MDSKHTPGPWKAVDLRHQKNGQIRVRGGEYGPHLANVLASGANAEADAKLIAAAPQLADALERALPYLSGGDRVLLPAVASIEDVARAALRAAGRLP